MCLAGLNAKGCQPLRVNPRSLYLTPPSLPTPVSLASSGSLGRLHYLFAGSSFERGWLRTPDRDTHPPPLPLRPAHRPISVRFKRAFFTDKLNTKYNSLDTCARLGARSTLKIFIASRFPFVCEGRIPEFPSLGSAGVAQRASRRVAGAVGDERWGGIVSQLRSEFFRCLGVTRLLA